MKDKNLIVYSGSFNPWHKGHERVYDYIHKFFGKYPIIEINFGPSDCTGKKEIDHAAVLERISKLPYLSRYIITPHQYFVYKAAYLKSLFKCPNITFAIGSDTARKLDEYATNYNCPGYEDRTYLMELLRYGVKFLVFPRTIGEKIELSENINEACLIVNNFIPVEISSTEIRQYENTR